MKQFEISKFSPCREAIEFRAKYETFKEAWENCPRGDWMLWIAKKLDVDLRTLTLAKALCAKTVLHLMKDDRSKKAVEVAEKFGNGIATREELDAAADDAADDAAYAAYAAYAAADAYAYAYAAAYAAADDARIKNQMETANICRNILTKSVFEKLGV